VICSRRRLSRKFTGTTVMTTRFSMSAVTTSSGVMFFATRKLPAWSCGVSSRRVASKMNACSFRMSPSALSRLASVFGLSPVTTSNSTSVLSPLAGCVRSGPRRSRTMSATNGMRSAPGLSYAQSTTAPETTGRRTVSSPTSTTPAMISAKSTKRRKPPRPLPCLRRRCGAPAQRTSGFAQSSSR
jgi:hypothetical protein